MSFDKARNLVKLLLVMCVVLCLGALFTEGEGTISLVLSVSSLVAFIGAFAVIVLYCKCRYCGKAIFLGLFAAKTCPHCRRDLVTGVKKKGKSGRR